MNPENTIAIYDSCIITNMEISIQTIIQHKFHGISDVTVEIIGGYGASELFIQYNGDPDLMDVIKQFVSDCINKPKLK